MPASTLNTDLQEMLAVGESQVKDPGDAGTIAWGNKGLAICELTSAGAETRTVEDASSHAVGEQIILTGRTVAGAITITGPADGTVVISSAGDYVVLTCVPTSTTTYAWKRQASAPLTLLTGSGAAPAASGLLIGGGTSAAPVTTSVADAKFVEVRAETTATSGDNRLAYLRYSLNGGGGGEALRAFTVVDSNVGTAHGAHLSLIFDNTAGGSETSGLGAAVRGTTHIPNVASWAPTGSVYSGMFEIYSDGSASDPAGLTELALLCLSNSGNATGAADVDDDAFVFSLQGFTAGAGHAVDSTSLAELPAGSIALRIKVGSATYYIPAVAAAELN